MCPNPAAKPAPSAAELEAAFERVEPFTVGLEEEVMLLDPATLDLAPRSPELLERLGDDRRFKPELPAAQLEILTEPAGGVGEAIAALRRGREDLAAAAEGLVRPAVAGVHPFASASGELLAAERYAEVRERYGWVATRQLLTSLQVHVAVGGAARTLAVYNALRRALPELAALAANAAFYEGVDTGMASVRPKLAETLPRQGVPPPIASWEEFAGELAWGIRAGGFAGPRYWWWELRPHPAFGTLEVRVPDAQSTLGEAAAIAAPVQALVASLARRWEEGELAARPEVPTWRIEQNRWSAARWGVEGEMADLESGEPEPTRERLRRLLAELEPIAAELGSIEHFAGAWELVERNGAIRQRELGATGGAKAVAAWLADHFLD